MFFSLIGTIWKKMPKWARRWLTRSFQTTFTISAAGLVTNERGEILLLNHVLRPHSGWGLPGGFMNAGEQPEAALRREIREEVGIELENVRLVEVRTLYQHIEVIFTARGIGEPKVLSREITELGWFALDDLPDEISSSEQALMQKSFLPQELKK